MAEQSSPSQDTVCLIHVQAEIVSLGGGILLAICLLLSAVFLIAVSLATATFVQRLISGTFALAGWLYFVNSSTEQLFFQKGKVLFTSALSRAREIDMSAIESVLLVHEGLNLEQGIETLEIRLRGLPPERLALGPCWQRNKLERFLHALEDILHMPKGVEEVR